MSRKKLFDLKELLTQVRQLRKEKRKIVFTNGCFDILHKGHIYLLQEAASMGDFLILGLNHDDSVKRLKGPDRPLNNHIDRAYVLAALEAINAIVIFEEDTPLRLIKAILPDVLVKGGDYEAGSIVGYKEVSDFGGRVVCVNLQPGYSSSAIIEKSRNINSPEK